MQISYIGMQTTEVAISPNMKVVLKSDAQALNEVVVVAYGTASKSSITGAVASIDSKKLELHPVTDATGALEGAAPGIQVNNTYGEPGSDKASIRIRGFGSVNGTNDPLIVVDGVIYEGSMSDINSNDIESMSVLKDASSSALYGNKAANGVILITTKKGKDNKLNVRANVKQGIYNRGIPEYSRLSANEWMETMWKGYQQYYITDKGNTPAEAAELVNATLIQNIIKSNIYDKDNKSLFDSNGKLIANQLPEYNDLDWNKKLERLGYRQEYSLSADAGGEKYDVYSSISYLGEDGYVISSDFRRFSGRMNVNYKPVKWFKTGANVSASSQESDYANSAEGTYYINPFYAGRMMAPVYPIYKHNTDGSFALNENGEKQYNLNQQYLSQRHIIYELENDLNKKFRNTISGQIYGTITFLKDFTATVKGNMYNANLTNKRYNNPNVGDGAGNNGRLYLYYSRIKDYNFAQELFWGHQFDAHHLDVLVAHESFKHTFMYDYTSKTNQKLSGNNTELSNFSETISSEGYSEKYTTESYLARARYNFDDKYYFDASFRRDGSSRFYNPWGNFWSVGANWNITREKFMESLTWINNLKLRASYGEVGNDAGVDYYAYKALFNSDTNAGLGAYYKNQNLAKDLKWETSSTLDIAIEGRLFDRLNFSFDFFDKRSRDLLFNVYNPLSAGATDLWGINGEDATAMSTISKNIGSVSNRGLEIALDVDAIRNNDWRWNIGVNMTYLKNKVISLPDGKDILHGIQKYAEGHSIYEFFTYKYAGVDQMNGRGLYNADPEKATDANIAKGNVVKINDQYYAYDITYAKKDWCGSALPKVYGSLSTMVTYKDISLSVLGTYSLGGKVYDSTYASLMSMSSASPNALHKDLLKAWTAIPEGMTEASSNRIDPNGIPRADLSKQGSLSTAGSSRWLKNASYFVLKNINLSYNFPEVTTNKMGIGGLGLFFSAENVFTITSQKGMNPQYSFKGDMDNTFVTARVFSFGLNLKF